MSIQLSARDSRSPTAEPTIPQGVVPTKSKTALLNETMTGISATDSSVPFEKLSPAKMRNDIEARLDEATRKEFVNTINTLMRLGNRNRKFVEPRRQKVRDIVMKNKQVIALYNEYAHAHATAEKRLTFRLPIVADLEAQEGDRGVDKEAVNEGNQEEGDARVAATEQLRHELVATESAEQEQIEEPHQIQRKHVRFNPKDDVMGEEPGPDPSDVEMSNVDPVLLTSNADPALFTKVVDVSPRVDSPAHSPTLIEQLEEAARNAPEYAEPSTEHAVSVPTPQIEGNVPQQPWSGPPTDNHIYVMPVTNPKAFPIQRVQVVQAQHYPSAKIIKMWTHRNLDGTVVKVTADMQDGPVNHLIIKNARIITALGLREGTNDFITTHKEFFRLDETFLIHLFPDQRPRNLKNFVVGELLSARHAYLHWLDYRGSADPARPPYAQEARVLATRLGRRAPHVWKEVDEYWQLEQGNGGRVYRKNRLKYFGEDPTFTETARESRKDVPNMWG